MASEAAFDSYNAKWLIPLHVVTPPFANPWDGSNEGVKLLAQDHIKMISSLYCTLSSVCLRFFLVM